MQTLVNYTATLLFLCSVLITPINAQISYTADDIVPPYAGKFHPGVNPGYIPSWTEEQLADIAVGNPAKGIAGIGVKSIRPALYGEFMETYGYDYRLETYDYYEELGLTENTILVGFPAPQHRDPTYYCGGYQSELFANLYEPIWDNGENGTPVNDNNYMALYLYKLVTRYGDKARFWEIWNEPGLDYTGALGWFQSGQDGNWWDNDPDPCDYKLRAPIQHFVRTLRISYEVIKFLQPDDYVVLSGTGYPSFLDAILRNTDNPNGGEITPDFPKGGGAYFDVMGFHSYPHFDGSVKVWSDVIGGWDYSRHSDAAAQGLIKTKEIYNGVLENYGYGLDFPEKHWIITECNIPRRQYSDYIGGEVAQRNFIMKAYWQCVKNDILQLHIYALGEEKKAEKAASEFEVMGLYQKLFNERAPYAIPNEEGTAYKTTSDLLFEKTYDPIRTANLNLPGHIDGGAFRDNDGNFTYMLWAKTLTDRSEEAHATYSFPSNWQLNKVSKKAWDYSTTLERDIISASEIELTATPVFLTELAFTKSVNKGCAPLTVALNNEIESENLSYQWTFENANINTSNAPHPQVTFAEAGTFDIQLKVQNAVGETILQQTDQIVVKELPTPAFDYYHSGPIANFSNISSPNTDHFLWEFGDGHSSTDANPSHVFFTDGNYPVTLTAVNECGAVSVEEIFPVQTPQITRLTQTANDYIAPYDGYMRPGINFGVYRGWTDDMLADISAGNLQKGVQGIGSKSVRPALYDHNLGVWGYEVLTDSYDHFSNLNMQDNTVIVGFPRDDNRDPNFYCPTKQSEHFEGLYLDIWDNGENGTPINDDNLYAVYLYNTVLRLKDHVQFWEIWNEPSFDYSSFKGWLPEGQRGNWWENDPEACDYKLRAPIYHFVRVLRISYEIIKTYDPEAYVTLSGVGYPSFLDAILRNTDNPQDGAVADDYPLGGGAYFDVMGFHSYPHFDGSTSRYDTTESRWIYNRQSDAAAAGVTKVKNNLQDVLTKYGYDDTTYPEKKWVVTEINIPRKQIGNYIGSEEAQRNFMIKAYVEAMIAEILQFHVYSIGEEKEIEQSFFEFEVMGLYQKLDDVPMEEARKNSAGTALKTTTDLLYGTTYDATQTAALELPEGVKGAAFKDAQGNYIYTLWAKTLTDNSEEASASYSFPAALGIEFVYKKEWDFSQTLQNHYQQPTDIPLTGTPIFLSPELKTMVAPTAAFRATTPATCAPFTTDFHDLSIAATSWEWTFEGGQPSTSTAQNPTVTYSEPGNYAVTLKATNAAGEHTVHQTEYITAQDEPEVGFTYYTEGQRTFFETDIPFGDGATHFFWDFGDGFANPAYNPEHFYFYNGEYEVTLITTNDCGTDTTVQTIVIAEPPIAEFIYLFEDNCSDTTRVEFKDYSPSSPSTWNWSFPGGTPLTATNIKDPIVDYAQGGAYTATMVVSNVNGSDTISETFYIAGNVIETIQETICPDEEIIVNGTTYDANHLSGTEVLPNASFGGCDSTIYVQLQIAEASSSDYQVELCASEFIILNGTIYNEENLNGTEILAGANQNGCDSIVHVQLQYLPSPELADFQTTSDNGTGNGSIDISIQNGTPPYQINWSNGEQGTSITGLFSGIYTASITDANGCSNTATFEVGSMTTTIENIKQSPWSVTVYPNPVAQDRQVVLAINSQVDMEVEQIELVDMQGRVLERWKGGNLQSGAHLSETRRERYEQQQYEYRAGYELKIVVDAGVYFWRVTGVNGEQIVVKQVVF